jgi:hypothetical protein
VRASSHEATSLYCGASEVEKHISSSVPLLTPPRRRHLSCDVRVPFPRQHCRLRFATGFAALLALAVFRAAESFAARAFPPLAAMDSICSWCVIVPDMPLDP